MRVLDALRTWLAPRVPEAPAPEAPRRPTRAELGIRDDLGLTAEQVALLSGDPSLLMEPERDPHHHVISSRGDVQTQCLGCGIWFVMGGEEVAWFLSRDLSLPRRCAECRAERRRRRNGQDGPGDDRGRRR